jgi:hypothetical protein
VLWVGGTDLAGNATPVADRQPVILQVRYIRIVGGPIVARRPDVPLAVGIDTDAATYWWKLGGRHGVASGDTLHVLAPKKPGVYRLAVGERAYTAHATVIVGKAK